jgi:hypothetical protein
VQETLDIAKDVARRLPEAQAERQRAVPLKSLEPSFDYPLIIGV